jgi:hypothetical protein
MQAEREGARTMAEIYSKFILCAIYMRPIVFSGEPA